MKKLLFFVLIIVLVLAGCNKSTEELICPLPNKNVHGECCIDQNNNQVCDFNDPIFETKEEAPEEPTRNFAKTFSSFWSKKSYKTLYELFSEDFRNSITPEEFEYLAELRHKTYDIVKVEVEQVSANQIKYRLKTEDSVLHVLAGVVKEDSEWRHVPFFYFENLDLTDVCKDYGNSIKLKDCGLPLDSRDKIKCIQDTTETCFMNYAILVEDKDFCDEAGDHKTECLERLGEAIPIESRIKLCNDLSDNHDRWQCLIDLAEENVDETPCADLEYDLQQYECLGNVAGEKKNVDLCIDYTIKYDNYRNRYREALCIFNYVKQTRDKKSCKLIDAREDNRIGDLIENCYRLKFD